MKKALLFMALFYTHFSIGQSLDNYRFEVQTNDAYTPLDTGKNLTEGLLWEQESFKIPLGFTSKIGDKMITDFSLVTRGIFAPALDTQGVVHAFMPISIALTDRSFTADPPQSPIRYVVEGVAPNRIFKLEFFNAGFYTELYYYRTNNDFVNFQVWLYETTDIVEFHYGASKISYPEDYFGSPAPAIGYLKNVDIFSFYTEMLYYLSGDPDKPMVDSMLYPRGVPLTFTDAYPDSGTVYRFIPKSGMTSIGEVDVTPYFKVYPTMVQQELFVAYGLPEQASAQVMDISGRAVQSPVMLLSGSNHLDMGSLPAGQYLIRLATAEGNAVYRFTKL